MTTKEKTEELNGKLEFNILSLKNEERCEKSYHKIKSWSPTDWACALAGEVGEACNFVKKLKRLDSDIFWSGEYSKCNNTKTKDEEEKILIESIGKELADVVIYADLLASRLGLRLGYEVKKKFNETSDVIGSPIKL